MSIVPAAMISQPVPKLQDQGLALTLDWADVVTLLGDEQDCVSNVQAVFHSRIFQKRIEDAAFKAASP